MKPPWEAHPEIPWPSIGWRMGIGEDYLDRFYAWFATLNADAKAQWLKDNPEPEEWEGFAEMNLSD